MIEKEPGYWSFQSDIHVIILKLQDYQFYIEQTPLLEEAIYSDQKNKITEEWEKRPFKGGGRTKEADYERLLLDRTKAVNLKSRLIFQLEDNFRKLFSYWTELHNDYSTKRIEETKFIEFLKKYNAVVILSRKVGLIDLNHHFQTVIDLAKKLNA